MICLNCHAAELELKQDGTFYWCSQCNRAFTVEAVAEIEQLRGIVARCYDHLDGCSHGCSPELFDDCEPVWQAAEAAKEQAED